MEVTNICNIILIKTVKIASAPAYKIKSIRPVYPPKLGELWALSVAPHRAECHTSATLPGVILVRQSQ